jgi:hypothetical protein
MASRAWLWGSILFVVLFVGLAVVSATTSEVDRLWLNAPDWSRAKLIGDTAVRQPVALTVDDTGTIYLLTLRDKGSTHRAHVTALNRSADILWERTLEGEIAQPEDPRIFWDGQDLHLFWLDDRSLYAAQLDASGNSLAAPALLSGGRAVGSYDLAPGADGAEIWYGGTRREPGIYARSLQDHSTRANLVDAEGVQPTARYDSQGTLHAAWVTFPTTENRPNLYYAAYPGGAYRSGQQTLVAEIPLDRDSTLLGPWLGLDDKQVYLFWTDLLQTAEHGYLTQTEYLSFPLNQPGSASEPRELVVPNTDNLAYEPFPEGTLAAGQRVVMTPGEVPRAVPLSEVWINPSTGGETVLALRADLQHQRENAVGQIGTLFMENGAPSSYQLLSFNPKFSQAPALISDSAGRLYATWIERREEIPGYQVYLASTAPDIRQALSPLTRGDVGRMVADTFFGMLTGAVFSPIAMLLWLVLPFLILAVTWPLRRHGESITSRGSLLSIALALLAYWAVKLVTFAQARGYIPFSGWIPIIPSQLGIILQLGLPVAIALIAFAVAWYVVKRIHNRSAAVFVILYALVDSFLSMAIYGGLLYDAF